MAEFYLFNTNGTFTKSEKEIRLKLPFREPTRQQLNLTEFILI
jgi:hypothetical protein